MFKWFRKCAPCFDTEREQHESDGSTPRTPGTKRRMEESLKRSDSSSNTAEEEGTMFWTRELDGYHFGKFSTAVTQGNVNLEDYSQVEVGRTALFVGVYDGHAGYQTASYVRRNLTRYLMGLIRATKTMSEENLRKAFLRTEQSWMDKVKARFLSDPYVAGRGTCCLVGVIWRTNLYLANVGDSRAIIGRAVEGSDTIVAQQLTKDDNVRDAEIRAEVQALHPHEPDLIVQHENAKEVYLIKGISQVSRSIGDAFLKQARFNLDKVDQRFKLNAPVRNDSPALSAKPHTYTIPIEPSYRFLIFASDGLWDLMSNQEAANIVQEHPKEGIAARLITEGLTRRVIKAGGKSHEDLLKFRRRTGDRRKFHDDISVVVIFFDHTLQGVPGQKDFSNYSIREGSVSLGDTGFTGFTALDELVAEEGQESRLKNKALKKSNDSCTHTICG